MKKELEKVLKEKSIDELRDILQELLDNDVYFDVRTQSPVYISEEEKEAEVWHSSKKEILEFINDYTDNKIEGVLKGE